MIENRSVTLSAADGVLYPVENRFDKVMIVMSGSEGGLEHAEKCARYLQDQGIPAFALGYFKTKHSPRHLSRINLETVGEAIAWLQNEGYEKVGIEGASKGAEFAAAAAIAYPVIGCVILKTPSWFYSEGMIGKQPSGTSCWSWQGKELPFTPYKTRKLPAVREFLKYKEYHLLEINTGKAVLEDSVIPIEKIQAPVLMFSTEADTVWSSAESCRKMEERLQEKKFSYPYKHVKFQHMSHMMLEYCSSAIRWFMHSEKKFPEECAKERLLMGEEAVQWIENIW